MQITERLKTGIKTGLKLNPAECESFYDDLVQELKQTKADMDDAVKIIRRFRNCSMHSNINGLQLYKHSKGLSILVEESKKYQDSGSSDKGDI